MDDGAGETFKNALVASHRAQPELFQNAYVFYERAKDM